MKINLNSFQRINIISSLNLTRLTLTILKHIEDFESSTLKTVKQKTDTQCS